MSRIKTISLAIGSTLFLVGAIAVIGWIGFQEHFRLLANSLRSGETGQSVAETKTGAELSPDPRVIETVEEATLLVGTIEAQLLALEEDGLPAE